MIDRALLESLVHCSSELQKAHRIARDSGREDIAQMLRKAQWQVAAALADCVPDSSEAVVS
jgi:hypothetical protein